jgi:hypothetical protein
MEEAAMNKQSKRNLLLGSGALAAVLLVVFAFWYPPVDDSSATGAIGAVEKHRSTQIAAGDVILGDEAARKEDQIVFAAYLKEAEKLGSVSMMLASAMDADSLASFQQALGSIHADLASHTGELEQNMMANFALTLQSMEALVANNRTQLSSHDFNALQAELRSFDQALQSFDQAMSNRSQLGSADFAALDAQLGHLTDSLQARALFARNLASMDQALASLSADNLASSIDMLNSFGGDLDQALQARMLNHRQAYLSAMVAEHAALGNALDQLGSFHADLASRSNLQNLSQLGSEFQQLGSLAADLQNQALTLQNRALANMELRLEARVLEARHLASMDQALQSMTESLGSRGASSQLQSAELQLASMRQDLQNRRGQLEQRMLGHLNAEMAAFEALMANRSQLGAQARTLQSADFSQLGVFSLNSFADYLANATESLESRAKANRSNLGNADQLESQARQLGARAAALQARVQQ